MHTDKYGQLIFNQNDLCGAYLRDPDLHIKNVIVNDQIHFDEILNLENVPNFIVSKDSNLSTVEFDKQNQNKWYIPKEYMEMDIVKHILDQCKTEAELQRVGMELLKFQERNMMILLKYLKYLVDTMRKNNIVYGVGRGSSVASYVLFLLGVHRINSLYYDLSIDEFLK